jgi:hypothetical protein
MSANASSTASSSLATSRLADRPRRSGSTTVVCSTNTRVSLPSTLITGRNVAGRALVDVGATLGIDICSAPNCLLPGRLRRSASTFVTAESAAESRPS